MLKTIHIYRLTDAQGNQSATVINDLTDSGRIGGIDKNGTYQQYDSYELWYAYDWAEKHGMKLEYGKVDIDISKIAFQ